MSSAFIPSLVLTLMPDRSISSRGGWRARCRRAVLPGLAAAAVLSSIACSASDLLDIAPPAGLQTANDLKNTDGAEAAFAAAKGGFISAMVGQNYSLVYYVGMFSDEFHETALSRGGTDANVDARRTVYASQSLGEPTDNTFTNLLSAYSKLSIGRDGLVSYETGANKKLIGEAYALIGYTELALAENFCPGVVLDRTPASGGVEYGMPLSTDSLFATAEAAFDSALAHANGDTTITALASVGLGRARLGRGHFADAASAVAAVPTSFVYWLDTPNGYSSGGASNLYNYMSVNGSCVSWSLADRDGGNGLAFASANDPRLVVDSLPSQSQYNYISTSCDQYYGLAGAVRFYWPHRFTYPSTQVALATGVEARLIEAEAALQGSDVTGWMNILNALRDAAPTTYTQAVAPPHLTSDSTITASATIRVDVMFHERALWLFGTGTRLGDLRRLLRQYGRSAEAIFPTGTYVNGTNPGMYSPIPTYGTDISFTLPTDGHGVIITNPHYQGCLSASS